MLCSPSVSALSFDRGAHQDSSSSSLAIAPPTSAHYLVSTRTPSAALSASSSSSASTRAQQRDSTTAAAMTSTSALTPSSSRPRHHLRSFSAENRFVATPPPSASASSSSTSSPMNGKQPMMNVPLDDKLALPSPNIIVDPSSPPATSISPPPASLPIRAKRSPPMTATNSQIGDCPLPTPIKKPTSPQSGSSPALPGGSPTKKAQGLQEEEKKEQERLQILRQQQANRRPKMMRLTPAFSSTPHRIAGLTISSNSSGKASQSMERSVSQDSTQGSNVQFPCKSGGENEVEPGAGLQIDLGCIPTPSLQDLEGPISTSHLDSLIRDRNGNPIKPSLKSPRASVSHFMPGRTSRSDSTPALPSSLHSKSVPSTPTVHKAVHFDSHLEHIKLFKNKQRPTAVSRDGSPEHTETETEEEKDLFPYIWRKNSGGSNSTSPTAPNFFSNIQHSGSSSQTPSAASRDASPETEEQLVLRLPNFPSSTRLSVNREIFLERIFLAEDLRSVKGTVQVRNMSFEKWVAVRYTLDHWATIGEVSAEYSETIKGGQADRFTFSIKLNELLNWPRGSAMHETKSMFMCLRYTVNSTEFWDNNEGHNYQLDFRKRQMPATPLSTPVAGPVPVLAQPRATIASTSSNHHHSTTRHKAIELARKGGVGGKGMFAMEDLKRELDKLRSDEEEEIQSITAPQLLGSDLAKKRMSPPSSPARSVSPLASSAWTARYDFGQSLRNPRNGSRNTGMGRAAALDYFSAKPMSRNNSNQQVATIGTSNGDDKSNNSSNTVNSLVPNDGSIDTPTTFSAPILSPSKFEQLARNAKTSPDFSHKFGMISPGLGDGHVEHQPIASDSTTPSTTTSPSPTPTPSNYQSPMSDRRFTSPDRFHSFPPNRHSGTSTPTTHHQHNGTRMSPAFFTPTEEFGADGFPSISTSVQNMQMFDYVSAAFPDEVAKKSGITSLNYSPSASPLSDGGSPNPFSPSDSLSSVESDTTVSNSATPDDRLQHRTKSSSSSSSSSFSSSNPAPSHARRINGSNGNPIPPNDSCNTSSAMATSSSTASLNMPGSYSSSFHRTANPDAISLDADMEKSIGTKGAITPSNIEEKEAAEAIRPASMSDYQELINKYCWNNDLVPSGGSTIPDMPMNGGLDGSTHLTIEGQIPIKHSPTLKSPALHGSGTSTPTLR